MEQPEAAGAVLRGSGSGYSEGEGSVERGAWSVVVERGTVHVGEGRNKMVRGRASTQSARKGCSVRARNSEGRMHMALHPRIDRKSVV